MTNPVIGFWDTEWTPAVSYTWGSRPKYLPNDFLVEEARLLCYGARYEGKKKVDVVDERIGRKEMLTQLWDFLDSVDLLVSYNGATFDSRKVNSEFAREGFGPPSPYKEIDLYKVYRQNFSLYSGKLGFVADAFIGDTKVDTGGFQLWKDVMAGDDKAWRKMRSYQKTDVDLLVTLFDKLRPWIKLPHPVAPGNDLCRNCGSDDLEKRGQALTLNGSYQRLRCRSCSTWGRGSQRTQSTNIRNV